MNLSERVEIMNTRYYNLINRATGKALYIGSGYKEFRKEKAMMDELNNESLGQTWMIFEVNPQRNRRPDCFQIVHTRSTLVLTRLSNNLFDRFKRAVLGSSEINEMRLDKGNWLQDQLFYIERPNEQDYPNILRFRSYANQKWYMHFDRYLILGEIDKDNPKCWWQVRPCFENSIINRSCYIENAFSTLAIDVPEGSVREGTHLIQYQFNNRFNQRFNITPSRDDNFMISNLNSHLVISTSKKAVLGSEIVQENKADSPRQRWRLEYQGKNLYLIRSVMAGHLYLGIKDRSIQMSNLVLTDNQDSSLWKIIGYIPQKRLD